MSQQTGETAIETPASYPLLVVISGPSGVGKDSVVAELKKRGNTGRFAVTATTRAPRAGEQHGVDYIFLDYGEFQELRANNGLLECVEYSGRWYGVPRSQVEEGLDAGADVFLEIDVRGAESIRELAPDALFIFLAPSSLEELAGRLAGRQTESPDEIERRLAIARQEMEHISRYEYCVVNRDGRLEQAVSEIEAIIVAEKRRVNPRKVTLRQP